jgi:hypothetical protein
LPEIINMSRNIAARAAWAIAGFFIGATALREVSRRRRPAAPLPQSATPPSASQPSGQPPASAPPKSPSSADWKLLALSLAGELVIAAVLAGLVFRETQGLEERLAAQAEARDDRRSAEADVRENVRFVRQAAMDDADLKPFEGIDLHAARLSGLDLTREQTRTPEGCANFKRAPAIDGQALKQRTYLLNAKSGGGAARGGPERVVAG